MAAPDVSFTPLWDFGVAASFCTTTRSPEVVLAELGDGWTYKPESKFKAERVVGDDGASHLECPSQGVPCEQFPETHRHYVFRRL